jgi:cytochrome c553
MMEKARTRQGGRKLFVRIGALLLGVLVVAGVMYGPEVYGLLRVSHEIDAISGDIAQLGPWPRATDSCLYCHDGPQRHARTQLYARLAGQQEAYLRKQLKAFASGERNDPTMTPFALSLTEREFESMVTNFSRMRPQPNDTFHGEPARVARGEALAKANQCASCHGQQLEGKDAFPRLAGQSYDYLIDQLNNFKSGKRHDATGMMPAVVNGLSARDFEDLAQFLASR